MSQPREDAVAPDLSVFHGSGDLRRSPRVEINVEAELVLAAEAAGADADDLLGGWFDGDGGDGGDGLPDCGPPPCARGAVVDISPGGLRMRGADSVGLRPGDVVQLRLSMPGEREEPMTLSGTVLRTTGDEAAVRFGYLPAGARARLSGFVDEFAADRDLAQLKPNYLRLALQVPLELY